MNSDYFSFPTELDAATDLEVSPVSEVRFLKRRENSGMKIEKKRLSEERLIEKYETWKKQIFSLSILFQTEH